jgi:hypothetical protein
VFLYPGRSYGLLRALRQHSLLLTRGQVAVAVAIARANMSLGGGASKTLLAKAWDDIDGLVRDPRWDPFKVKRGLMTFILLLIN